MRSYHFSDCKYATWLETRFESASEYLEKQSPQGTRLAFDIRHRAKDPETYSKPLHSRNADKQNHKAIVMSQDI